MLSLGCDVCGEIYYLWDTTRQNTEKVAYNDLYRQHLCGNCKTALSLASHDLEPWAETERNKFQNEYEVRKQELTNKYRGKTQNKKEGE